MSDATTSSGATCWTQIEGAALGDQGQRAAFVERYGDVLRAFFGSRWRVSGRAQEAEDAVQEVLLECLRSRGALERADRNRGGFRAFLQGVAKNVARRIEERAHRDGGAGSTLRHVPDDDTPASRAFDRAWAQSLMREAAALQAAWASSTGAEAERRIELLRLRFGDDLPIRDIAARWSLDPTLVHREYRRAREEFRQALREVVCFHQPGSTPGEVERECSRLTELLGG